MGVFGIAEWKAPTLDPIVKVIADATGAKDGRWRKRLACGSYGLYLASADNRRHSLRSASKSNPDF